MKLNKFSNICPGEKGQAALFDSLFFLAIVSVVGTFLFFYAINYGVTINDRIDSFYSADFAADSLKVISYVNATRDGTDIKDFFQGGDKYDEPAQFDYLLALIKEDYYDKQTFSPETRKAIVSTLGYVLRPFNDSLDYTFYMVNQDSDQFLFLLLAVHGNAVVTDTPVGPDLSGRVISDVTEVDRLFYYCQPSNKNILEQKIFPYVGKVDFSREKISLSDDPESDGKSFIMGLEMWVARDISALTEIQNSGGDFNCSLCTTDFC